MSDPAPTRLVFVATADEVPPRRVGVEVVVCDTAWTPGPGARPDLVPIRPAVTAVLARADLLAESLVRVDDWARAAGMVELLAVDGVSYWFRLRETLWNWLHERLLWCHLITELQAGRPLAGLDVLADEEALVEVARALETAGVATVTIARPSAASAASSAASSDPPSATSAALGPAAGLAEARGLARAVRRLRRALGIRPRRTVPAEHDERARLLDERIAAWAAGPGPRVLAVSLGVRHAIAGPNGQRLVDPHLDAVLARCRTEGLRAGVVLLGHDHFVDDDWRALASDPDAFPASLLRTRWRGAGRALPKAVVDLPEPARAPLLVDGIDFGGKMLDQVREFAARGLVTNARLTSPVTAMLDELRPDALLLTHEGHREPWILAARRASIPTFAIQHGILYPTHPGYAHPRNAARMMADCTFVYGDYERDVLLRYGAYLQDEVEVSGSPRLDLDRAVAPAGRDDDRAAMRRELGIADGDRLLVVSTTNGRVTRRFDFADVLARILGGPLPGVHVVFKQHPGERDEGPYRATLQGLAAAGGYAAPAMTVVREIDLYRLLRAADAHLGFNSTVLTEAVMTGAPNLIAAGQRYGDVLGYVEAGVAVPVRTVGELLGALDDPRPPDPDARQTFLASHFRDGDASSRIVARMRAGFREPR